MSALQQDVSTEDMAVYMALHQVYLQANRTREATISLLIPIAILTNPTYKIKPYDNQHITVLLKAFKDGIKDNPNMMILICQVKHIIIHV